MTKQGNATELSTLADVGLLHHVINFSREAVVVLSEDSLVIVELNQKSCQVLGYSREELIGKEISLIECSLQDVFFWDDMQQTSDRTVTRIADSEWLTKDGVVIPMEKRVSFFGTDARGFWIIHAEDITARIRVNQEQIHLASQLQSSLEATAEGILSVDLRGNVININHRFISMWHLTDQVLIGRHLDLIVSSIISQSVNGSVVATSLERVNAEPDVETADQVALLDGRYVDVVSKPEYYRDQLIGRVISVRDITAMKQVEHNLKEMRDLAELANQEKSKMLDAVRLSESRLRRLVNASLVGIIEGSGQGHLIEANQVLLTLLGYDRVTLERGQLNLFSMMLEASHAVCHAAFHEIDVGYQATPFESTLICADGSLVSVMIGLARLEGTERGWVGFVLDLTEQKKADKIKSEFIAVVSHELRTPLTSIRGALGLLEHSIGKDLPPKLMQLLKIAHKNSQRLGALVNDLLDIEKLVSGKMSISSDRVDLVALAQQAMEFNSAYAQQFDVRYYIEDHPKSAWVICDADRVMQVFANLLSNAAKFSHPSGMVAIRILDRDDMFRVEIEDYGQGIPSHFHDQIFSKFAQADGGNTRKQGGTGLGLNISKTFIEKMGGQIGFESREGEGSVFWFTLTAAVRRLDER